MGDESELHQHRRRLHPGEDEEGRLLHAVVRPAGGGHQPGVDGVGQPGAVGVRLGAPEVGEDEGQGVGGLRARRIRLESAFSRSATRRASSPEALAERKKVCTPSSFARSRRVGMELRCREMKRSGWAWLAKITRSAERELHVLLTGEEHLVTVLLQCGLQPPGDVEGDALLEVPVGADCPFLSAAVPGVEHDARALRGGGAAAPLRSKNARAEVIRPGILDHSRDYLVGAGVGAALSSFSILSLSVVSGGSVARSVAVSGLV